MKGVLVVSVAVGAVIGVYFPHKPDLVPNWERAAVGGAVGGATSLITIAILAALGRKP
jgi:hypothetical protein